MTENTSQMQYYSDPAKDPLAEPNDTEMSYPPGPLIESKWYNGRYNCQCDPCECNPCECADCVCKPQNQYTPKTLWRTHRRGILCTLKWVVAPTLLVLGGWKLYQYGQSRRVVHIPSPLNS